MSIFNSYEKYLLLHWFPLISCDTKTCEKGILYVYCVKYSATCLKNVLNFVLLVHNYELIQWPMGIYVFGDYTVSSLVTTNSFHHLWWRNQSYDPGVKWIYRRKRIHAPARLNEQFMNFYWRKFWRGGLKLLIVILRFQIEIEGLDLIILESWLLEIRINIDSVWYMVTFSIITTVRRTT